jgi:hypothetical protein
MNTEQPSAQKGTQMTHKEHGGLESDSTDALHSHEDRLLADAALEPELAHARDHGHVHEHTKHAVHHAEHTKHEHHTKHEKHEHEVDDVAPGPFSRSKGAHTSEDNEEV